MKVTVEEFNVNWLAIKNLCRGTVNMKDSKKEPTSEWKRKLLVASHSPLRHSMITVKFENIPSYVSTHLARHHMGVEKFVGTSREDRTGVDRSERRQTDPVNMRMDLNIESLINISRKRLCMQADPVTRKVWEMVVSEIAKYDEDIAWACVPEGIHQCGCPEEFGNCKKCLNFLDTLSKEELLDLKMRITKYQENEQNRSR